MQEVDERMVLLHSRDGDAVRGPNPYRRWRTGNAVTGSPGAPIVDEGPGFAELVVSAVTPLVLCLGAVGLFGVLLYLAGVLSS